MTASPPLRSRRRKLAPLAAAVLVALLLGGVGLVIKVTGGSGLGFGSGGDPPTLHLTTSSGSVPLGATDSGDGSHRFVLIGTLPSERPEPAQVYRFGGEKVPADLVRRLAKALGVQGTPVRTPTGWQVGADHRILTVRDGGDWAWSLGPNVVVADSPVQCFRAPCPYETPDSDRTGRGGPAPPDAAVAARVAKDALTALDLPTNHLTTTSAGQQTLVRVPRPVDGKTTDGFSTTLSIGADNRIDGGNGWLGQPTRRGPSYPLITAADAFKRLQAQPYPEILLCRPQAGGGCAPSPQVSVTGATLGMMMAIDSVRPVLVPAWLFTVAAQADPIAVVAVESRYLGMPKPEPSSATSDPGSGGGSQPKSEPPAPPTSVPPGGPTSIHNPGTPPPA